MRGDGGMPPAGLLFYFRASWDATRPGPAVFSLACFRRCAVIVRFLVQSLIVATSLRGPPGCRTLDAPQTHPVAMAAPIGPVCTQAVTGPRPDLPVREVGGGLPACESWASNRVTAAWGRGAVFGCGRCDVRRHPRARVGVALRGVGRDMPGGRGQSGVHGGSSGGVPQLRGVGWDAVVPAFKRVWPPEAASGSRRSGCPGCA